MFSTITGAHIAGIAAAVPNKVEDIADYPLFDAKAAKKFSKSTGVYRRRIADKDTTTADLCCAAGERLIKELGWEKSSIDLVVLVTQTADYQVPATSPILQHRLGLDTCATVDINNGCSGWVYGLNTAASMLAQGEKRRRALLFVGDTLSKVCSPTDKTTYPLFGDAATCTAIEWDADSTEKMQFTLHTDGAGADMIKITAGGARNPLSADSLVRKNRGEGICRADNELYLGGMDVFGFGITIAPECVQELINHFNIKTDENTLYTFHQANLMMNEMIRIKLDLNSGQVLEGLTDFANTSGATIPLTLIAKAKEKITGGRVQHIGCGFGVGTSWGAVHFTTDKLAIPDIAEV